MDPVRVTEEREIEAVVKHEGNVRIATSLPDGAGEGEHLSVVLRLGAKLQHRTASTEDRFRRS